MIGLVRAADLDRWASRITSAPEFPRLVRRLVHATGRGLQKVDFPADESIRLAGWDGKVLANEASPFVPAGFSAWEMGTNQNPRAKANEDYIKRTDNPAGVDPAQATFIFVTPRRWPGRDAWIAEKRAEGKWKDVIALDAESLAQWLEGAPGVAAWFGPVVGAVPTDVRALEADCETFNAETKPAFTLSGLLVGRDAEREKLLGLLQGPPLAIEISATTTAEAVAFVGACIESLPEDERDPLWARAIWVDSSAGLRAIAAADRSLIVAASGELQGLSGQHHRIVTKTSRGRNAPNAMELGPQPVSALVDYLAKLGMDRNDAYERCQEAGGYLERVRHALFVVAPPAPAWATGPAAVAVAAIILVGEWDEKYETDKAVVTAISGMSYEELVRAVTAYQTGPAPLVSRAGSVWKVYARPTVWMYLEPFLTTRQLQTFLDAAREVLLEPDPRFELEPKERWMAEMHDKRRAHSDHLREGLANGLVHAAALGRDDSACYAGRRAQVWVDSACHRLFERRAEEAFWRRIRGELRELAEASPDQFLSALEVDLVEARPQVCDLFEEEGDHGGCLHSDLLWALELVVWAPEYVSRAALVLAKLAELDPGGRWSNRPHASLAQIMLPLQPQCTLTADERGQLFRLVTERVPRAGWNLGKALMPKGSTIVTYTARPQLRTWAPAERRQPVLVADYWAEIQAISERLLELAGDDAKRWDFLLSQLKSFLPPLMERVLQGAEDFGRRVRGQERLLFWARLRKLLHHHNQFSRKEKVDWVYSREILDRLEVLYASLTPTDLIEQVSWLFAFQVARPIDVAPDWREEAKRVESDRMAAAEALAKLDVNVLSTELPRFQNHRLLGYCLGRSSNAVAIETTLLSRGANSEAPPERDLARGFAAARYEVEPDKFLRRWCSRESLDFLSERGTATIAQALPSVPAVWDVVEAAGPTCSDLFWREVSLHVFDRPQDAERGARCLLSVGRALTAIDLLAMNIKGEWLAGKGDVQLVVEALKAGVHDANANRDDAQRVAFEIAELIKLLAESKRIEIADLMNLEWIYFGVLEYQAQHELVIYQHLISEPELLLQLISLMYVPEGESREERPEPTEPERAAAEQAWRVLNDWKPFGAVAPAAMPGAADLLKIVDRIRKLAAERRHGGIVDDYVGKALASAPLGVDGAWPHESVREILERYDSKALTEGFVSGKFNLRGTTSRSPGDGGDQERELAAQYAAWQRALVARYPRTAALLGRMAERYRSDANSEDIDVRRR
jgi:hypothetical protein